MLISEGRITLLQNVGANINLHNPSWLINGYCDSHSHQFNEYNTLCLWRFLNVSYKDHKTDGERRQFNHTPVSQLINFKESEVVYTAHKKRLLMNPLHDCGIRSVDVLTHDWKSPPE
jgi:hypothetical protein